MCYLGGRVYRGSRRVRFGPTYSVNSEKPGAGWGSLRGMEGWEAWLTRSC